jgi:hypothetical protein
MRKRARKEVETELRRYRQEYEEIKARILTIGFICKGSITERWIPCGTPSCACHKDTKKRHGPYFQLSWKEKGKTLSHFLSGEKVDLYREWIQNRRTLMEMVDEMEDISRKAGDCLRSTTHKPKSSATQKNIKKTT